MRKVAALAVATSTALVCSLADSVWGGAFPPTRNGFMIGFGIGGASFGGDLTDGREGGVTGNFRTGYAVGPDLALHFEGNAFRRHFHETFDDMVFDATWMFSTAAAAVTYFPPGTGLFLRGGIGLGRGNIEWDWAQFKIDDDETGFAFLAAAGYEWRQSAKFALAPQIDFTYHDLDTFGSSNIVGGSVGFNWYW